MTNSTAQSDGKKAESGTTPRARGLGSPAPILQRGSSVMNLIRSLSRGEDADSAQPKNTVTKIEVSSQLSDGAISKATVSYELEEPAETDPPTPYDIDIVAVHGYGESLHSAWAARVQTQTNLIEPMAFDPRNDFSKRAMHVSTAAQSHVLQSGADLSVPQLEPNLGPTTAMIVEQAAQIAVDEGVSIPVDEKKTKLEDVGAWIATLPETPGSSFERTQSGSVINTGKQTVQWLRDSQLLPGKFNSARILLFQYGEPVDDGKPPLFQEVIQELAQRLGAARKPCPDRPIIFLGQDFGITIIESTLMDLWKTEGANGRVCAATAGIAFFISRPPASKTDELRYFDTAVHRRLGPNHEKLPYQEVKSDQFLVNHIENFKSLRRALAQRGPGITLKCFMSNGNIESEKDPAYCAFLKLVACTQEVYGLLTAAGAGNLRMVRLYLAAGRDRNLQNSFGQSALHLAVQHGRRNVVRLLTKSYHADVSLCDTEGQTALHLAIMHCGTKLDIITMLLERGADARVKDKAGKIAP